MISTRAELIERLKDVKAVEITARKGYVEDLLTFSNFQIKSVINRIKSDEDRHIQMLDELINTLEGKVN